MGRARVLFALLTLVALQALASSNGLAQREGDEPGVPAGVLQQLPWAWVEVYPPRHWHVLESDSLTRLAFERRAGDDEDDGARAWLVELPSDGVRDPLQRIQRDDVRLDGLSWQGWQPRSPRRVQLGAQPFAELRNTQASLERIVALALHGDAAVVLVVDGGVESEWMRSGTFEFQEPVEDLRGRLAVPALPQWQLPVPFGYEVERMAPRMLALRHGESERVVMQAREVPHALDLNDAFGEAEQALQESLGLRRHDAFHMPRGRLDGLLADCTLEDERRAWVWWGYDPASRTLLTVLHEYGSGGTSAEVVRQRLTELMLPHLRVPEPTAPHPRVARIVAVRAAAHVLEDGSRQIGIVFLDEAQQPVVFRGFPYEVRLTYANRPLPGVAETVRASESRDVLPRGLRAPQLRLSSAALERLGELSLDRPVTVEVRFADGHTLRDELPLGVLLAE